MRKGLFIFTMALSVAFLSFWYLPREGNSIPPETRSNPQPEEIKKLLKDLESEKAIVRQRAAYRLTELKVKEVIPSLIKKLEGIMKRVSPEGVFATDGDGEYTVELICMLGKFKAPETIPTMLKVVETSVVAVEITESFAMMGPKIIKPLIEKFEDKNKRGRWRAKSLYYLKETIPQMAKYGYTVSDKDKKEIKRVIIKAFKDKNRYVRKAAIYAAKKIEDFDFIPLLESCAKSDPYSLNIVSGPQKGRKVYPLREEAEKVLKQLEAKKKAMQKRRNLLNIKRKTKIKP